MTGQPIISSKRICKGYVVPLAIIMFHHCWIPITNVQKSFGDISKVCICVKNKSPLTLYYLTVKPTLTVQQMPISILNNQFVSGFTKDDHSILPIMRGNRIPDIEQLSIGVNGVYNLLVNIDPHKATGPDGIPSRLLKETAYQKAPLHTFIFQSSLDQGKLPSDWKIANITPLYKKGSSPSNFRPISLTSVCCKVLEHIIHLSIYSHLEKFSILCDNQHGFHTKRSCETQLIGVINDFLNSGSHIDALFLDFGSTRFPTSNYAINYLSMELTEICCHG